MTTATQGQVEKICELIRQKKIPQQRLQRFIEGGLIADFLSSSGEINRSDFRKFLNLSKFPSLTEVIDIVIPDKATIRELIIAGQYKSCLDSCILDPVDNYGNNCNDAFIHTTVQGARRLYLAHFGASQKCHEVSNVAQEMGYALGMIEDILAIGAHPAHRNLQLHFPIVALGSPYGVAEYRDGSHSVAMLDSRNGMRFLSSSLDTETFSANHRFIFVGKNVTTST